MIGHRDPRCRCCECRPASWGLQYLLCLDCLPLAADEVAAADALRRDIQTKTGPRDDQLERLIEAAITAVKAARAEHRRRAEFDAERMADADLALAAMEGSHAHE